MKMDMRGFTVIELLTVIIIIFALAGIGIPAYNSWVNRDKIAKAKAMIQQIEMALEMYKTDNGVYPNDSGDLNNGNLVTTYLTNYMQFKAADLNGNVVIDPWGRAYAVYVDNDGDPTTGAAGFVRNLNATYILSQGPSASDASDDIDNYEM